MEQAYTPTPSILAAHQALVEDSGKFIHAAISFWNFVSATLDLEHMWTTSISTNFVIADGPKCVGKSTWLRSLNVPVIKDIPGSLIASLQNQPREKRLAEIHHHRLKANSPVYGEGCQAALDRGVLSTIVHDTDWTTVVSDPVRARQEFTREMHPSIRGIYPRPRTQVIFYSGQLSGWSDIQFYQKFALRNSMLAKRYRESPDIVAFLALERDAAIQSILYRTCYSVFKNTSSLSVCGIDADLSYRPNADVVFRNSSRTSPW